jgi:hypothetical protein
VLKSLLNRFRGKVQQDIKPAVPATPELLGMRLGGAVELNDIKLRMIEDSTTFKSVNKIQLIQAVGAVKLDEETSALRFYTDDDGFFQFILEGGTTENHISDGKLWFFYDTYGIGNSAEWDRQLEQGISQPTYSLDDHEFTRLWKTVGEHNPPVAMRETTYSENGTQSETDQFIMLYEREASDSLIEYLMVSGEERIVEDNLDRCLVVSTGIDITLSDFSVIG